MCLFSMSFRPNNLSQNRHALTLIFPWIFLMRKIYVGKLPPEGCTDQDIRTHFEQFGTVVEVIRPVDKAKNDEPKNFAFVTFQNEEISKKLVKLGEDVMCKTKIVIKPVITKVPVVPPNAPHHLPTPRPIV